MSARHVAPHRWADAGAGRLSEPELAAMERHAQTCERCSRARDHVTRATSQTFAALRAQTAPELPWDSVRARVHWALAAARRESSSRVLLERVWRALRGWRTAWLTGGAAVAGLAIVVAITELGSGAVSSPTRAPIATATPTASLTSTASPHSPTVALDGTALPFGSADGRGQAPTVEPAALIGLVSRLAGDVMIDGLRVDGSAFDRALGAGTVLATGDGRVDVQFGDASAFALGPRSRLELRKFDAGTIELVVDGTIDIEVAPRAAEQRFSVIAGDDTIVVRGTQFRVVHEARGVRVACRHGLVAVHDTRGERDVGATRALDIAADRALGEALAMSSDELAQLAAAVPITVPLPTDALARASAPLEIASVGQRAVRIDGVEVGEAPLRVRVMPGRHTVEAADLAGRFRRAGWVDVGAAKPARLDVRGEEAPIASNARKRELDAGIEAARGRLMRCTRAIAKAGVTDTFVQVEIAVDAAGAVGFLNVLDTDLPSATSECVQAVLRDIRFAVGVSATWREKIDL